MAKRVERNSAVFGGAAVALLAAAVALAAYLVRTRGPAT
jgi:hypothetical protein